MATVHTCDTCGCEAVYQEPQCCCVACLSPVIRCDFCHDQLASGEKFMGMDACPDCLETLKRCGVTAPTCEILDPIDAAIEAAKEAVLCQIKLHHSPERNHV